jgi:hypothetical protein
LVEPKLVRRQPVSGRLFLPKNHRWLRLKR